MKFGRWGHAAAGLALLGGALGASFRGRTEPVPAENPALTLPGDARQGWQLFFSRNCIECHSLWGEGGTRGPDLGRASPVHLSASGLAAEMCNHVPAMRAKMEEEHYQFSPLTLEEMSNLFAFLYFIRSMDEPGDPVKGQALLQQKHCITCHSIKGVGGSVGPDLTRWGNYINPIVWANRMWVNAPRMEREMKARGVNWPELNGSDMVQIIAYVRSATAGQRIYLEPGSPTRGKGLFVGKGCASCHPIRGGVGRGPDLGRVEIPRTVSETAFLMWNHSRPCSRKWRASGSSARP